MSEQNLIRILTIFDTSEEAESLINLLRNAGHIVRDLRVEDDEDMEEAGEEFSELVDVEFELKPY